MVSPTAPSSVFPRESRPWIQNPVVDLLVGCGAWSLPLFLLSYVASNRSLMGVAFAFYVLGLFSNNPHYMATIYRVYGTREDFSKYRFFTLHVTVILVAVGIVAHASALWFPIIWTIYLTWSPWHYTGQNYGLAVMFIRRNETQPTPLERRLLYGSYLASYLSWFLSMHASRDVQPNILSLGIPVKLGFYLRIFFISAFLGMGVHSLYLLSRRMGIRRLMGPIALFSTQFLWFVAPTMLEFVFGMQFLPTSYSGGILAFMHCTQYLWITGYYAKKETESGLRGAKEWNPWSYYGLMLMGGIALFLPGPWIISRLFHHDLVNSYLIFLAIVNIHHFVLDGAIWKLRDGRIAQLLLGKKGSESMFRTRFPAWNWLFGSRVLARGVRWGCVALLLGLGFLDPFQYYLTLDRAGEKHLALAQALNASDTRVYIRRAMLEFKEGRVDEGRKDLEKAITLNPRNLTAQQLLGLSFRGAGETQQALKHYQRMEEFFPKEVSVHMYLGDLFMKSGNPNEAIVEFEKAEQLDPHDPQPDVQLGQAYRAVGNYHRAMEHYEAYLKKQRETTSENPL